MLVLAIPSRSFTHHHPLAPIPSCTSVQDFFAASAERELALRQRAAVTLIVQEPDKSVPTINTHSQKELLSFQVQTTTHVHTTCSNMYIHKGKIQ